MRHETVLDGKPLDPAADGDRDHLRAAERARFASAAAGEPLSGSALTTEEEEVLRRAELAAKWMDSRFRLPLTDFRFGLDGLLGLIPGVGDGAGLLVSGYVVYTGWKVGLPMPLLLRMAGNVALDAIVGAVPLLGDLLDFAFKANRRNAALLREHFETRSAAL
ncbi:DUF4112 domain-containing protein [Albimonas sp. CAU 1670]|uniref:DUF4112 domain-containing protein n=1 Tax=Albimonas sp. CAU 1670 TaxID=3032599 RepID=UPI0023DB282C|nr:DUF4112 domain-containing protein [Albimonas sp. CAU 1670]MDF2234245.1 DUF4112 domain-containing protein [Albimonas sp. CAU 1670]